MTKTITRNLFFIALVSLLMSSCSTSFYQVYKTQPDENLESTKKGLVYEDENCKIAYNLWAAEGDIGFLIYNKTDENIYLDLTESFFVVNDMAQDYYKNRVYANSKSVARSVSTETSASKSVTGFNMFGLLQNNQIQASTNVGTSGASGTTVSIKEAIVVTIPPKTAKVIDEYTINSTLYRDCDLYRYPRKNQIQTVTFNKEDSPIVFSNRIAYSKGADEALTRIENEFYVNAITNYTKKEMIESKRDEFCGEKDRHSSDYFKDVAPNKFYVPYKKSSTKTLKH